MRFVARDCGNALHKIEDALRLAAFLRDQRLNDLGRLGLAEPALAQEFGSFLVGAGNDPFPRRLRFVTFTLRYNALRWVTVDGLNEHWEQARIDAEIRGRAANGKAGGGGGRYFPSIVVVAPGEPGVPVVCWALAGT